VDNICDWTTTFKDVSQQIDITELNQMIPRVYVKNYKRKYVFWYAKSRTI